MFPAPADIPVEYQHHTQMTDSTVQHQRGKTSDRKGLPMTQHSPADLAYGLKAIAAHLGVTPRQAQWLHESGKIPTFKMGNAVCALRSAIDRALAERAASARAAAPGIDSSNK